MPRPEWRAAGVIGLAGAIIAAVTAFLFCQMSTPATRGDVFIVTLVVVVCQELLFASALAIAVVRGGVAPGRLPVVAGSLVVVGIYNLVSVAAAALFFLVLVPEHASAKTYYSVIITLTGLFGALLLLVQLPKMAHQVSNGAATRARSEVAVLVTQCERLCAISGTRRPEIVSALKEAAEVVRFSESVRRNPAIAAEIARSLETLEALLGEDGDAAGGVRAREVIRGVVATAGRAAWQ